MTYGDDRTAVPHDPPRDPWMDDPSNQAFLRDVDSVLKEIRMMLIEKRKGYGPPKNLLRYGEIGIVIRTSDKLDRLQNFIETKSETPEGKRDAWRDIIGYGVLGLMNNDGCFK